MNETLFQISKLTANTEPQIAIWWFIPILIGAAIVTAIIIYANHTPSTPVKGTSIELLGMKQAGKTTFLNWLRYKEFRKTEQTITDKYDSFYFYAIEIIEGVDIGGDKEYIRKYYNDKIVNGDIVIFIFNASLFLSNKEHREEVLDRAYFIWEKLETKNNKEQKYHILATHYDKTGIKNPDDCVKRIIALSDNLKEFFNQNVTVCDLTKKESVNDAIMRIFNTKIN